MVRASNFAASSGKRHKTVSVRTIKEAPAALSRPYKQQSSSTHAPSRSMPSGPFSPSTPATGLSSLQAIQALLGELEHLPAFPKQRIEILSVLRFSAMLISLPRHPVAICLLLLLEFYFVEYLYRQRERRSWEHGIGTLKSKLRSISVRLLTGKKLNSLYLTFCKVPVSKAVDYVNVIRDGKARFISSYLLVPGDVIVSDGKETVICDKCPLRNALLCHLKHPFRQLHLSAAYSRIRVIFSWTFLLACALRTSKIAIIPLLLLSSQLPLVLWWLLTSAHLKLLSSLLVASPTPYVEASEDDAFDEEAPPPVLNVSISPFAVLKSIFKGNSFLRGDLVESLGLLSVLSFTDREGAISEPFLKPIELVVPSDNEAEICAIQVAEGVLNFSGSNLNATDLKAIGLAFLMTSECEEALQEDKPHCRSCTPCHYLPEQIQSCYCRISKEIGLNTAIYERFKRIKTFRKNSHCISQLVLDSVDSSRHLFVVGELNEVLKSCSLVNVSPGSQVLPLRESLARKLIDFEWTMRSSDVFCAALAYRPQLPDEAQLKQRKLSSSNFIFLGLLATAPEPKANFQEFIDDLDAAGVRFALLSSAKELASKAFAERLGLETDWNSCILLSEHPHPTSQVSGYSSLSDIKARLPRGVSAIRPHLQHVDDIPLHVSIFAECDASSCSEMVKIYQEAGEVIGLVCSSRGERAVFEGDLFICYDSFESGKSGFDEVAQVYLECFGAHLILPSRSSPYILTELIRESRTILLHSRSAWEFFCGVLVCSVFCDQLVSLKLTLIAAALSISICFGVYDSAVLKTHPLTRTGSLPLLHRTLRFLPFLLLSFFLKNSCSMLMIGVWTQSLAFLHPVRQFSRKQLVSWKIVTLHGLCLLPILVYYSKIGTLLLSLFIGGILFGWQEWMKRVYLQPLYGTFQKRSKLLFSTKLGMHSPV